MARACGSYPQCRGFKSLLRYHFYIIEYVKIMEVCSCLVTEGCDPKGEGEHLPKQTEYVKIMEV